MYRRKVSRDPVASLQMTSDELRLNEPIFTILTYDEASQTLFCAVVIERICEKNGRGIYRSCRDDPNDYNKVKSGRNGSYIGQFE